MNPVTPSTAKGTPVGTTAGIVHLLDSAYLDQPSGLPPTTRVFGMCDRQLRGKVVERPDAGPTCQTCVDERDYRAAQKAGFEHRTRAVRRPLGHSPIAGFNTMRYGAQVDCYTCPVESYRDRTIWYSNEAGQMAEARKIARQHFLDKYRESLAAKPDTKTGDNQ